MIYERPAKLCCYQLRDKGRSVVVLRVFGVSSLAVGGCGSNFGCQPLMLRLATSRSVHGQIRTRVDARDSRSTERTVLLMLSKKPSRNEQSVTAAV